MPDGVTCESIFGEFMSLEFTDPSYGQVHFLTVACYMIQHHHYSDEAYVWIQSALMHYLEKGRSSEKIRLDAAQGPGRTKGIRRPSDAPLLPRVAWSMTIADVAAQVSDAESYRSLIHDWGLLTLNEMEPLVLKQ